MSDAAPTDTTHRYAVYYAPRPGTPHWDAGSRWLGRSASSLESLAQSQIDGVAAEDFRKLTAAPRRYGWHATLTAPFVLAPGANRLDLHRALQQVARGLRPFAMPPLTVRRIDDFLALVPDAAHEATAFIESVAAACVTQLHDLSAPLPPAEIARRRAGGLTTRQDELLQRWGYPFVLDEFRFHMSLTGNLRQVDEETQALVAAAATRYFAGVQPPMFDSLALFAEPAPGADFMLIDHVELAP